MVYKFQSDYLENYCTPLYIYQNTFSGNKGCARSFGMVSAHCFFGPDITAAPLIPVMLEKVLLFIITSPT